MNTDKNLFPSSITTTLGHQTKYSFNGKWYKFDCYGYEAAAEYISSQLAHYTNLPPFIDYSIMYLPINGIEYTACCSSDFLGSDILVSSKDLFLKFRNENINEVIREKNLKEKITYFVTSIEEMTGIPDYGSCLTHMLEYDAFILNEGRSFDNIQFLYNDTTGFSPAPLFDFGDSFLSDMRNKYPSTLSFNDIARSIEAKPFDLDFTKQLDMCHYLYGTQLQIDKSVCFTSQMAHNITSYYGDYIHDRIAFLIDKQITLHRNNFINTHSSIFSQSFDSQIHSAQKRSQLRHSKKGTSFDEMEH